MSSENKPENPFPSLYYPKIIVMGDRFFFMCTYTGELIERGVGLPVYLIRGADKDVSPNERVGIFHSWHVLGRWLEENKAAVSAYANLEAIQDYLKSIGAEERVAPPRTMMALFGGPQTHDQYFKSFTPLICKEVSAKDLWEERRAKKNSSTEKTSEESGKKQSFWTQVQKKLVPDKLNQVIVTTIPAYGYWEASASDITPGELASVRHEFELPLLESFTAIDVQVGPTPKTKAAKRLKKACTPQKEVKKKVTIQVPKVQRTKASSQVKSS